MSYRRLLSAPSCSALTLTRCLCGQHQLLDSLMTLVVMATNYFAIFSLWLIVTLSCDSVLSFSFSLCVLVCLPVVPLSVCTSFLCRAVCLFSGCLLTRVPFVSPETRRCTPACRGVKPRSCYCMDAQMPDRHYSTRCFVRLNSVMQPVRLPQHGSLLTFDSDWC